jgi:4a-hydroxytetrahydrobiopterin dehydratase
MSTALTREALRTLRCKPLSGPPVPAADLAAQLQVLTGWGVEGDGIARAYRFSDYPRTIAFVNAVAALAEREDHHPDLQVSWGRCTVRWSTHSAGGVSLNDFICAVATDTLFDEAGGA